MENFAVQVFSDSQDELERFVCLDAADDSRERADGAAFCAGGDEPCRRRGWVLATQAWTAIQVENADLAFELVNRAEHKRNAVQSASVVDQVASLVVVRAVNNEIVAFNFGFDVRCVELFLDGFKDDILVDVFDFVLC